MYLQRSIEKAVKYMLGKFPVLLVTGPRQVGKTTMLRTIAEKNRNYVSLDNPIARELAVNEPGLFLERYEPPVIIDEIQYAPNLMEYIKIHVDENMKMGEIWMTGSQKFHLMRNVTESLAGRVGILKMQGFSASELDKYEELTQVADEMLFLKFLTAAAARTSQMLNLSDMAKDVGISIPTSKKWLSILVTSGIVVLLEPYHSNRMKRLIKSPNLYFVDTGLCSYLTRWQNPESLEAGAMSGAIFETYVISEIIKGFQNQGKIPPIYYYRDKDKREIDLILEQDGLLYPVEIKKSGSPKKEAVKHFSVLEKSGGNVGRGAVICMIKDLMPLDSNNWLIPLWLI